MEAIIENGFYRREQYSLDDDDDFSRREMDFYLKVSNLVFVSLMRNIEVWLVMLRLLYA